MNKNMVCRLAKGVQVRKEKWGLLFYSQTSHKVCFIGSGDLFYPHYFDGTWTLVSLIADIANRVRIKPETVKNQVVNLTKQLEDRGMVVNELC